MAATNISASGVQHVAHGKNDVPKQYLQLGAGPDLVTRRCITKKHSLNLLLCHLASCGH
jgi:hypothetical protein